MEEGEDLEEVIDLQEDVEEEEEDDLGMEDAFDLKKLTKVMDKLNKGSPCIGGGGGGGLILLGSRGGRAP